MNCIAVITTVASRDDARRIAQALVERRLAACAQISAIESLYHWDGTLQHDNEFRLLLKTVDTQYDAVERAIRELHPYELPAIYSLPIDRIHAPYAAWVRDASVGGSIGSTERATDDRSDRLPVAPEDGAGTGP
jgi:periplasmic divalent cation tolerance protein